MNVDARLERPFKPLLTWFTDNQIEREIHEHDQAISDRATATAEGVDRRTFAKVIAVVAGVSFADLAVDADSRPAGARS